jgi:hypothetical protein
MTLKKCLAKSGFGSEKLDASPLGIIDVIKRLGDASARHGTGHKNTAQAIWSVARGCGLDFVASLALVFDHLDWNAISFAQNEKECVLAIPQAYLASGEQNALAVAKPSRKHRTAKSAGKRTSV